MKGWKEKLESETRWGRLLLRGDFHRPQKSCLDKNRKTKMIACLVCSLLLPLSQGLADGKRRIFSHVLKSGRGGLINGSVSRILSKGLSVTGAKFPRPEINEMSPGCRMQLQRTLVHRTQSVLQSCYTHPLTEMSEDPYDAYLLSAGRFDILEEVLGPDFRHESAAVVVERISPLVNDMDIHAWQWSGAEWSGVADSIIQESSLILDEHTGLIITPLHGSTNNDGNGETGTGSIEMEMDTAPPSNNLLEPNAVSRIRGLLK